MKDNNIPSWVASAFTTVTAAMSTNETAQLILYILGIVSALFSLSWNLWKWYKDAKKDGKIDEKEMEDLKKTVDDGAKEIGDAVSKTPEKEDRKDE